MLALASCGGGGGPKSYTVTASSGTGGTVSPPSTVVGAGLTTTISVSPSEGYEIADVAGCGGVLSGATFTTGPITAPCSVTASFRLKKYTVSIAVITGGTVTPASAVVEHGSTTTFTLTPSANFSLIEAKGCGGTLNGNVFTTGAITGACTVEPTFVPNVELALSISSPLTRVGGQTTLTWSAKHSTACTSSGSWTGSRAAEGTLAVPASSAGRFSFTLECTGRGAAAKKSVSLVVPYPVFTTSYENRHSLAFEATQIPSIRTLGIKQDAEELDSSERSVTFGDYFEEGHVAAFVSTQRSKNIFGIKNLSDVPGKAYFLFQDDRGAWVDRTTELLPNAADRDTCVTTSNSITADFNNDLKPDILVSCEGLQYMNELPRLPPSDPKYAERYLVNPLLFLSTSGKTYRRIELPFKLRAVYASSADLDGDGKTDIVLANIDETPEKAGLVVLLGNGDGTFRRNDDIIPRVGPSGKRIDDIGWIHSVHLIPISGRLDLMAISGPAAVWIQGVKNGFDVWTLKRIEMPVSPRTGTRYWSTDVVRAGNDFKFVASACSPNCSELEMAILKADFDSRAFSIYPVVVSSTTAFQTISNQVKLNPDGTLVGYTGWCSTPATGICKTRLQPDGLQTLSDIDTLRYIASYPDLIDSFGTDIAKARAHFEQTGAREGRKITFDPAVYVASHPDLIGSISVNEEQATRHYITTGSKERRATAAFDPLRYIASHGDVLTAFGFDTYAATRNYILFGYGEGRRTTFDGLAYIASYGDLIESIKTDIVAGIRHFIRFGFAEGRRVTFDALAYIASTGERIARFGTDVVAATRYYIETGFKAGEKATFSALAYLANNADLRSRFGGELAAATQHFITTGFSEKRPTGAIAGSPLTRLDAHRFLVQATFGPREADIKRLLEYGYAPNGYERWIDAEIAKPVSLTLPSLIALVPANTQGMGASIMQSDRVDLWFRKVMIEDDQLRQRMTWALSQIMVVSDNGALLEFPFAIADFQDTLARNAFGNYRKLLEDVTLHPAMGLYLSMLGNQRAEPGTNLRPDENYAREMMQLFSIGLVELNLDGSVRRDSSGQPIPTYNQEIIGGFARVFTGWGWGCAGFVINAGRACTQTDWRAFDPWPVQNFNSAKPMELYPGFHENGSKKVLSYSGVTLPGGVIPANQGGVRDLKDALDNVFNHPNVGPFISKQLIQKLVTSNPSPAYIQRVAEKFNNDGRGTRGNLEAVIKAILLDPEARDVSSGAAAGKVKEPLLRLTQLWRAYDAKSSSGKITTFSFCCPVAGPSPVHIFGQSPGQSPSVFNFFSPFYAPPGEIAQAGLVAPELQLANENLNTQIAAFFHNQAMGRTNRSSFPNHPDLMVINIDDEMKRADDVDALIDLVAEKLLGSSTAMSPVLREQIRRQLRRFQIDPTFSSTNRGSHFENVRHSRVSDAIYMTLISPEFAVQR